MGAQQDLRFAGALIVAFVLSAGLFLGATWAETVTPEDDLLSLLQDTSIKRLDLQGEGGTRTEFILTEPVIINRDLEIVGPMGSYRPNEIIIRALPGSEEPCTLLNHDFEEALDEWQVQSAATATVTGDSGAARFELTAPAPYSEVSLIQSGVNIPAVSSTVTQEVRRDFPAGTLLAGNGGARVTVEYAILEGSPSSEDEIEVVLEGATTAASSDSKKITPSGSVIMNISGGNAVYDKMTVRVTTGRRVPPEEPLSLRITRVLFEAIGGGPTTPTEEPLGPQWEDPDGVIAGGGTFGGFLASADVILRCTLEVVKPNNAPAEWLRLFVGADQRLLWYGSGAETITVEENLGALTGSTELRFVASLATVAEALTPEQDARTQIRIKNVCLSRDTSAASCTGNFLGNGDFSNGLTDWTSALGPDSLASVAVVDAGAGESAAQLTAGQVDTAVAISVSQTVTAPNSPGKLSFRFRAPNVISGEKYRDELVVSLHATGVTKTITVDNLRFASSWSDFSISDLEDLAGKEVEVTVTARIWPTWAPIIFEVDDVCFPAVFGGAMFSVEGSGSLTLKNMGLEGTGVDPGVKAITGQATLNRVYIAKCSTGLSVQSSSEVDSSIFTDCGIALSASSGGTLSVVQSTVISNGEGVKVSQSTNDAAGGTVNLYASLLYDNSEHLMRSQGGSITASGCCIKSPEYTTSLEGITVSDPVEEDPVFGGGSFPGELDVSHYATDGTELLYTSVDVPVQSDHLDFEYEPRWVLDKQRQVGADEVAPYGGAFEGWVGCSISPRLVGRNQQVTIDILMSASDVDWDRFKLVIVPEKAGTGALAASDFIEVDLGTPGSGGWAQGFFTVPEDEAAQIELLSGRKVFVDGLATVYLWYRDGSDTGVFLPPKTSIYYVDDSVKDNNTFLIDTIPPRVADDDITERAHEFVRFHNDSVTAAERSSGFPFNWPSGERAPSTYGTFDVNTVPPQLFFNRKREEDLYFSIILEFSDDGAGFYTLPLEETPEHSLEDIFEKPRTGAAYWATSNVDALTFFTSPTASVKGVGSFPAIPFSGVEDRFKNVEMTWSLADLEYTPGWQFNGTLAVSDAAGNTATIQDPLRLWWMVEARAILSGGSGMAGGVVKNPRISWKLERDGGGAAPQNVDPCYPLVQYRLWTSTNETDWASLTDYWSDWTEERTLTLNTRDRNTGRRIGDEISGFSENDFILIALRGADEAGNVQLGGPGDGMGFHDRATLDADEISYVYWRHPGELGNLELDTQVQAQFWYNDVTLTDGNELYQYDGSTAEYNLGASSRLPLPPVAQPCLRLEGRFTFSHSVLNGNFSYYYWELFEDFSLVARGIVERDCGDTLVVPADLLLIGQSDHGVTLWDPRDLDRDIPVSGNYFRGANSFLTYGPRENSDGCCQRDRLGDDGDENARRRDVQYTLQVRAVAETGEVDDTAASYSFTVMAPRVFRDTQPVKEEQRLE